MHGGARCRMHGGSAPQVREKAAERILALVDLALAGLSRILRSGETDVAKLRAIENVLDRAGFGRASRVQQEVSGGEGEPVRFTLDLTERPDMT